MSTILVKRFRNADESIPVFQQLNALFDEIRRRAFSFFEERGAAPGRDLDDWLAAEREILWSAATRTRRGPEGIPHPVAGSRI